MGLDMYLSGKKYIPTNWKEPEKNLMEDGFRLEARILELGYWRKHPNLHGFIVENFAHGVDECREIDLRQEDLMVIIKAVKENTLPRTEEAEQDNTIEQLEGALAWVSQEREGEWRSVVYSASR